MANIATTIAATITITTTIAITIAVAITAPITTANAVSTHTTIAFTSIVTHVIKTSSGIPVVIRVSDSVRNCTGFITPGTKSTMIAIISISVGTIMDDILI